MMHLVNSTVCTSEVMADCATQGLQDLPAPAFKVVLKQLSSQDYGSLRIVSRSLSQLTSDQLPYLVLRLSESSSEQHLQQWCQATKSLLHVSSIHVVIAGEVPQHVFASAMQLLSKRPKIKQLQLLAAYGNLSSDSTTPLYGCSATDVPSHIHSLQPVTSLLSNLQSLVIKGVAVKELAADLEQLAAATTMTTETARGWQLQNMTLQPAWSYTLRVLEGKTMWPSWRDFLDSIMYVAKAFPHLQHLKVCLPYWQHFESNAADPMLYTYDPSDVRLANITAIAALVNAALQLKALQVLTVTSAPDIWQLDDPEICSGKARAQQAALVADVLASGKLPTLTAAATALLTLDECGYWLLQHHPSLKELQISTARTGWGMSWKQQQESTADGTAATIINATDVRMRCCGWSAVLASQARERTIRSCAVESSNTASSSNSSSTSIRVDALPGIKHSAYPMTKYSPRSADVLLQLTTSCQLTMTNIVVSMDPLLRCFKNLRHLETVIRYDPPTYSTGSAVHSAAAPADLASAVTAAAAAVPSLESLTLIFKGKLRWLHDDLLLPLAAAGGSGSSLRKLQLQLVDDEKGTSSRVASAVSTWTSVDAAVTAAVESVRGLDGSIQTRWQHPLRQLHGLHELTILNACHTKQLTILVEHLPQSLQVFSGSGLNIVSLVSSAATTASLASAATAAQPASNSAAAVEGDCNAASAADTATPHLVKVDLDRCLLSDPSMLASTHLQQLTVSDTSWPGGWTAAATAWPEVKDLVWRYDDRSALLTSPVPRTTSGNCCTTFSTTGGAASNKEVADALATLAAATHKRDTLYSTAHKLGKVLTQVVSGQVTGELPLITVMQEIFGGFGHLTSLSLTQLSWLSVEVLQPMMQRFGKIRSLHLGFSNMLLEVMYAWAIRSGMIPLEAFVGGSMGSYLMPVQQWLQQQVPWANVCLYVDYNVLPDFD